MASTVACMLKIAQVTVSLKRPLALSQAVGAPVEVTDAELVLTWPSGVVTIGVRGRFTPQDRPWERRKINARHRDLDDLDATNPGLAGALVALVPQAPWHPTTDSA